MAAHKVAPRSMGLSPVLNEVMDGGLHGRISGWGAEQLREAAHNWAREVRARPHVKQQLRAIRRKRYLKSHSPVRSG